MTEQNEHMNRELPSQGQEEELETPRPTSIVRVAGVRIRPGLPPEHFDAGELQLRHGEWVVVETSHGVEVGQTVGRVIPIALPSSLPKVVRIASTEEIKAYGANLEREKQAWRICQELIEEHRLEMKLVRVESFFDGSKIIFYYSAEGRVDFRALVKDLVRALHTRIEMRQIGIRHEAKMVGGIGSCGRAICCAGFMKSFAPVSIKMAKAQNLPLNPNKISGLCGRLLCCITYEYESYADGTMAAWAKEAEESASVEEAAMETPGAVFPELDQAQGDQERDVGERSANQEGRDRGGRRQKRRPNKKKASQKGNKAPSSSEGKGQAGTSNQSRSKKAKKGRRRRRRSREDKSHGDGE